jgi:hypothetical protein
VNEQDSDWKRYLGDGVYADFDGYHIVLSTEREYGIHTIYLEPSVLSALMDLNDEINEAWRANKAVEELAP